MKVLMFGWEFPPHILGGLGTASYGLTKGMSQQDDLEITFCIPKPWGDEQHAGSVEKCRLGLCERTRRQLYGSAIVL